jgi:hypothetical protein
MSKRLRAPCSKYDGDAITKELPIQFHASWLVLASFRNHMQYVKLSRDAKVYKLVVCRDARSASFRPFVP